MAIPGKLSNLIFRARYLLHIAILALGLLTPWNQIYRLDPPGPKAHLWGLFAVRLGQMGVLTISQAFNVLLALGIFCAVAGAALRVWGSAYLGTRLVQAGAMQTGGNLGEPFSTQPEGESGLLADGPFRYVRNPLYLGTFLTTLAISLLMPLSGATFAIVGIGTLQMLLIAGEEQFLAQRLGPQYAAYCALVPRLWPRLRTRIQSTGVTPRWGQALLGEIFFVGVAASFAAVGWLYNAHILQQCAVVSFGVSLVVRAAFPLQSGGIKHPMTSQG